MLKRTILLCLLPIATSLHSREPPRKSIVIEDLELELIQVKAGSFTMGSLPGEPQRDKAEGPRMEVTFSHPFWLGKTEVTQAQYKAIVGVNPSRFKEVGPTAPVEEVSWDDAMKFCKMLTLREKEESRLPKGYEYTFPPKPSGNTPAGRARLVTTPEISPQWDGPMATVKERLTQSPSSNPTNGDFMICPATCLNGALTGTATTLAEK